MRNTVFGVFIALLGGNLLFMVSCEEKQSQPPPKEFDRKIDSIASVPLPIVSPGMADESSGGMDESGTRFQEPGALESESDMEQNMTPGTEPDTDEVGDSRPPVGVPTDPNST